LNVSSISLRATIVAAVAPSAPRIFSGTRPACCAAARHRSRTRRRRAARARPRPPPRRRPDAGAGIPLRGLARRAGAARLAGRLGNAAARLALRREQLLGERTWVPAAQGRFSLRSHRIAAQQQRVQRDVDGVLVAVAVSEEFAARATIEVAPTVTFPSTWIPPPFAYSSWPSGSATNTTRERARMD